MLFISPVYPRSFGLFPADLPLSQITPLQGKFTQCQEHEYSSYSPSHKLLHYAFLILLGTPKTSSFSLVAIQLEMLAQIALRKATAHFLRSKGQQSYRRANSTLNLAVRGTGIRSAQSISAAPYTIETDTYKALGGNEAAPSPLALSLASLSGCQQVTGALVAKNLGIKLGKWEVEVKGVLDTDVLVKGTQAVREGEGNWEGIDVKVIVETDVDGERFRLFQEETERRCTLSQLFIRSGVEWKNEWENVKLT